MTGGKSDTPREGDVRSRSERLLVEVKPSVLGHPLEVQDEGLGPEHPVPEPKVLKALRIDWGVMKRANWKAYL